MDSSTALDAILLGVLEGLTEFLPVSSTGHLILAGELLGFTGPASTTFKIVIQLGAILAVVVLYRRRFIGALAGLTHDPQSRRFVRNIMLAVIPALVIGVFAYKAIKQLLETPEVVAVALIVGGFAILITERLVKRPRVMSIEAMPARTALSIGLIQCLAMIPGVSRSGASILGALSLGVERRAAAEFSFFLAVPTMAAATVYDLYKSWAMLDFADLQTIGIGFMAAFLTALAGVKLLVNVVSHYGFAPFAWYRIVIGSIALFWLLQR